MCSGLLLIVLICGINAALGAVNGWDSFVYHLARVAHWAQNGTVANYPTNIPLQIFAAPLAEYMILQVYVLGHGDRLVNCVLWLSMVGSIIGASLVAREFGASRRGEILAALLVVTLPLGMALACSTKNDLVMTFWLICFVYFLMRSRGEFPWPTIVFTGLSLGLVLLTKGTGYIYCLPFLVVFILLAAVKMHFKIIPVIATIILLAGILNAPYYLRLKADYPDFQNEERAMRNGPMDPSLLASNIIRNIAVQLISPFPSLNKKIMSVVVWTHDLLNLSIRDKRITYKGWAFRLPDDRQHESRSPNPLHLLLIVMFLGALILRRDKVPSLYFGIYLWILIGIFILLNLLLKWQFGGSRFYLGLFVLFCPLLATWLEQHKRLAVIVAVLFFSVALPKSLVNYFSPLLGKGSILTMPREDLYVLKRRLNANLHRAVGSYLQTSECSQVGLYYKTESSRSNPQWEYLLWVYSRRQPSIRFEHVNISNFTGRFAYPLGEFVPCVIFDGSTLAGKAIVFNNTTYVRGNAQMGRLHLYFPVDNSQPLSISTESN